MQREFVNDLKEKLGVENLEDILKFPKYITIETTNRCNAKCIMCPHNSMGGGNIMNDENFNKIISELQEYPDWIKSVALYWYGEPLLDPKICEKIKMLKEIGIKSIQLSTNAERLDQYKAEELLEAGLNDLRISIDAIHKNTYEKIRGLNYEKVMKNVHNLLQIRNEKYKLVPIRIRLVEMEENKEEIDEFKSFWQGKVSTMDKVQIMPQLENKNWKRNCQKKEIELPCISVFSTLAIDVDGNICMCCMDTEKEVILGNIKSSTLKSVWCGDKIHEVRKKHLSGRKYEISICENCNCWQRDFKE